MPQLGAYEVEGEIGRGSMGCVLRARHRQTGVLRAIKVLTLAAPDVELITRFNRESELLARVGGEGVVSVHEAGSHLGHLYYVMDLVEGGSLRDRVKKSGALPWREAAALVARIARALDRCHEAGIVHRDMKLENVLLDAEGAPVLSDFGIARDLDARSLTATGALLGSPSTMAPEQIRGETVDRRADIYALGVILYELTTGTKPYSGATWVELTRSIEAGRRPTTHDTAGAPPGLDEVLGRCLAPRRESRFKTAQELAIELETLLRVYQRRPRKERGSILRWIWLAIGVVVVVNLGFFAVTRRGPGPPTPPPPAPVLAPSGPPWFTALAKDQRPELPLPAGLKFGERPGEYVHEKSGCVLVFVPGGRCRLGSEEDDVLARDAFSVDVPGFWIGKYEVTNAEFARFTNETGYVTSGEREGSLHVIPQGVDLAETPEARHTQMALEPQFNLTVNWKTPYPGGRQCEPNLPVVCLTWFEANAYVEWAGLDLPSENQWEKAASWDPVARKNRAFPWGDERGDHPHGNFRDAAFYRLYNLEPSPIQDDDGYGWLAPVGSFPEDRSPCGAFDMGGNAAEWCSDIHPARSRLKTLITGIAHLDEGPIRVLKGASITIPVDWYRNWRRGVVPGDKFRASGTGFRVALVPHKRKD
jgi:formylglycine-generating enzyme required for sulfatase activity